jgi:fructose-1,6-bisphosphatase/inositol monophosphatase family enzyme
MKSSFAFLLVKFFPYYDFSYQVQYLALLKELMQQSLGLRRMGAAAIDLAPSAKPTDNPAPSTSGSPTPTTPR